jgi:hypothetical protein
MCPSCADGKDFCRASDASESMSRILPDARGCERLQRPESEQDNTDSKLSTPSVVI